MHCNTLNFDRKRILENFNVLYFIPWYNFRFMLNTLPVLLSVFQWLKIELRLCFKVLHLYNSYLLERMTFRLVCKDKKLQKNPNTIILLNTIEILKNKFNFNWQTSPKAYFKNMFDYIEMLNKVVCYIKKGK